MWAAILLHEIINGQVHQQAAGHDEQVPDDVDVRDLFLRVQHGAKRVGDPPADQQPKTDTAQVKPQRLHGGDA